MPYFGPMKQSAVILAASALAGCATSAGGLQRSQVETTIDSAKSPQAFATCVAEVLIGNNQLRNDGDHYWVLRLNGYGVPTARWDFLPRPEGGSRAELRASVSINTGDDKVRRCA